MLLQVAGLSEQRFETRVILGKGSRGCRGMDSNTCRRVCIVCLFVDFLSARPVDVSFHTEKYLIRI
jgi:hypothetical protein